MRRRQFESRSLVASVRRLLGSFAKEHGFVINAEGDQTSSFGAYVRMCSEEFVVEVIRDCSQGWIHVGATVRPKPRAPLRSWSIGHLVAFLDKQTDPYPISDLKTEAHWLKERGEEILDSSLINSDELRKWAVLASHRLFG